MKKWLEKFVGQFEMEVDGQGSSLKTTEGGQNGELKISQDRATLLYLIDTYNKNLFEISGHSVRKVRDTLDQFARELVNPNTADQERVLFRFRQFFSGYRIDEYSYMQKTFDDFKGIVWDFVDQLAEDLSSDAEDDRLFKENFELLKEAVESDSIDVLKKQSREFIDFYVEHQTRRDTTHTQKMSAIRKSLGSVKEKLIEANHSMRLDHLTNAYNRKSFDEKLEEYWKLSQIDDSTACLAIMDIDFFKKINDNYGHPVGDFVLQSCVEMLQNLFPEDSEFVARIGGEEFAVILPGLTLDEAEKKCQAAVEAIRKEVVIHEGTKIDFTMSMGLAQLHKRETVEAWYKRADEALYRSKTSGRDRLTLASKPGLPRVA